MVDTCKRIGRIATLQVLNRGEHGQQSGGTYQNRASQERALAASGANFKEIAEKSLMAKYEQAFERAEAWSAYHTMVRGGL